MKYFAVVLLLIAIPCRADQIVYHKVKELTHPKLSASEPQSLQITYEYQWNGDKIQTKVITATPMAFSVSYTIDSIKRIEQKEGWTEYWDAFEIPESSSSKFPLVLVKRKFAYEGEEQFEDIRLWDLSGTLFAIQPKGSKLFLSSDGRFLVTGKNINNYYATKHNLDIFLYFYSLSSPSYKPSIEKNIKAQELQKLKLISLQ